jgi:hypothetical protein
VAKNVLRQGLSSGHSSFDNDRSLTSGRHDTTHPRDILLPRIGFNCKCLFSYLVARHALLLFGIIGPSAGTKGWIGCCPAVQHPSDARAVVHRTEGYRVFS